MLLTFPELLELPEGLEPEAQATVRYLARSGPFAAVARVARVAAGPPVTLTFKRLAPVWVADEPGAKSQAAGPPVSIHVVSSRVAASSVGGQGAAGVVQDMSDDSLVVISPVLLAVGDTLRLSVDAHSGVGPGVATQGRVVRVCECDCRFGVGVELVHQSEDEQRRWHAFVSQRQAPG